MLRRRKRKPTGCAEPALSASNEMAAQNGAASGGSDSSEPASRRPASRVVTGILTDGAPVLIRPLGPHDREALRTGMTRLSEETRYQRFLNPIGNLTEEQLDHLTRIDGVNHMAFGVADLRTGYDHGVGVGRYIRLPDDPESAELAITVVDSHQGFGLGTLLFNALRRSAQENGVKRFYSEILAGNEKMVKIYRSIGAKVEYTGQRTIKIGVPIDGGDGDGGED